LSIKLYNELVKRAKHFFNISNYDVSAGRYDIALFHLEQATQLALKAYLLKIYGDSPKIYSIRDLVDLCENGCVKRVADEMWYVINILEDAYIGARYFIRRYGVREYSEAVRFVQEVFKCIGILST